MNMMDERESQVLYIYSRVSDLSHYNRRNLIFWIRIHMKINKIKKGGKFINNASSNMIP